MGALCIANISFGEESSSSGQESITVQFTCSCEDETCAYQGRHIDMEFIFWLKQSSCPQDKDSNNKSYTLTPVYPGQGTEGTVSDYYYGICSAGIPKRFKPFIQDPRFKIYTFKPIKKYCLDCPNYLMPMFEF